MNINKHICKLRNIRNKRNISNITNISNISNNIKHIKFIYIIYCIKILILFHSAYEGKNDELLSPPVILFHIE